jgi:hypothetical protein
MVNEVKPKVYCPSCHRLLNVTEGKGEGDEMGCPYCLAQFKLLVVKAYRGEISQPSPHAVTDEKTPAAWRSGGTAGG